MSERLQPAYLKREERTHLLSLLEQSRNDLLLKLKGADDRLWNARRRQDQWCLAEIAEHLLLSERSFRAAVETALSGDPSPDWRQRTQGKDVRVEVTLLTLQTKAHASPHLRPQGLLLREEVVSGFEEERAKTMALAATVTLPLKAYLERHHSPFFDWLNAYQWLLYAGFHSVRHLHQVVEVSQ